MTVTSRRPVARRGRPARLTSRGRGVVAVAVVALVALLGTYAVRATPLGVLLGLTAGPPCTIRVASGAELDWSAEEAMTATTVAGVGTRIGATINGVAEAVTRALATVAEDDAERALTPQEARQVYRGLPDVARPEKPALELAAALLGHRGAALTCTVPLVEPDLPVEQPNGIGLTPRADTARREMRAVFGRQPLGGFAPEGVDSGHIDGSAHYDGRAVDVFFRPVNPANQRLGWQQAQWTVAHAERLHLATVIFDRKIWTAARSVQGWRDYRHPSGDTDNPVLMHEDHVHVDVHEGG